MYGVWRSWSKLNTSVFGGLQDVQKMLFFRLELKIKKALKPPSRNAGLPGFRIYGLYR